MSDSQYDALAEAASREIADRLGLVPGEPVSTLRRIRLADKRRVVLSDEALPTRILASADLDQLGVRRVKLAVKAFTGVRGAGAAA